MIHTTLSTIRKVHRVFLTLVASVLFCTSVVAEATTTHALRISIKNQYNQARGLQDEVIGDFAEGEGDGNPPTTCTGVPDGYDAFDVAAEEAFQTRDPSVDCHTLVATQDARQHPIEDVYPSLQETTRFELCVSIDQKTRYLFSNGLPDHEVISRVQRPTHCIVRYAAAMPLHPVYDPSYLEENPIAGLFGFSMLNGIPFVDTAWPMETGFLLGAEESWGGHANVRSHYWHYHSSRMPPNGDYPAENELVGYAMDGFAIYGPLSEGSTQVLDECNGLVADDGVYRYHMIRMEDIDFTAPMCNADDPRVHNWKPIIGCFRGSTANSRVWLDDGNREDMICEYIIGNVTTVGQQPPPQDQPTGSLDDGQLVSCLESIANVVAVIDANNDDAATYTAAAQCHNSARVDRVWAPKAIVKVNTAQQVAEAVKCAVAANVKVTPRSGAHGFENEACSGELLIDVSALMSLEVVGDAVSRIVEFGSGHLHGQLYKKLSEQYGWVVPGGTENSVGTAGLWLGCGRGPLTQVHGFTCDNVLGVEFVDAKGNIRVANANENVDVYWMARGGGGEFPGIVTKFTVQAYEQPTEVWTIKSTFEGNQAAALIKAWSDRIELLSDPANSMFTAIVGFQGSPILEMTCFSCNDAQKEFMRQQFEEITNIAGGGSGLNEWAGTWIDRLLREDWDEYNTVDDLAVKPDWPVVWATMSNGGHLVHSTEETNDAMLGIIQNALQNNGNDFYLYLYSMIPSSSNTLLDTAYGGRDAKYIVHYKWIGTDTTQVKTATHALSVALDDAGLQCKNFYNYADREFPCASDSGEAWLEAHFSDVPRMRAIRQLEDPNEVFVSSFKKQKWDSNQHVYVGMPEVGEWGGTCTCPNGAVYQVGDNNDACSTLACVGGIAGTCSGDNPGGAGFRAICDTSIVVDNNTNGDNSTSLTAPATVAPTAVQVVPPTTIPSVAASAPIVVNSPVSAPIASPVTGTPPTTNQTTVGGNAPPADIGISSVAVPTVAPVDSALDGAPSSGPVDFLAPNLVAGATFPNSQGVSHTSNLGIIHVMLLLLSTAAIQAVLT